MTNTIRFEDANGQAAASAMRGEIEQKWGRFDAQEIAALKDNDDAQLQAKYQLDKAKAQTDVDAFANGRQL